MIMTLEELRESADVFAIEMLDIQRSHKTLFGQDVAAAIDVPMNLHRVEVEHELRTTLLRLRHHLLLSPDNEDEFRAVLAKSITTVLTLFRHALDCVGRGSAAREAAVIGRAGEAFGFDVQPLRTILELRNEGPHSENLRGLYHAYMSAIQRVAHELDARVPKRQLQKMQLEDFQLGKLGRRRDRHENRNYRIDRNCVAVVPVRQHLHQPSQ